MKLIRNICIAFGVLLQFQWASAACDPEPRASAADAETRLIDLGVSPYEPLYFIVGGDGGLNAKFQLSFKYRIFGESGFFARCLHLPPDFYLSFSQTSLWDVHETSAPFKDSSYRPRLFYLKGIESKSSNWHFDFEAGFAHESNGKASDDSRSVNLGYLKPTISYYVHGNRRFYVAPMMYSYIDKGENPNIVDYRGNVDLVLGYGTGNVRNPDWNFWTTLRKGSKSNYGSVEVNFAIPFRFLSGGSANGWLLTQYFNGYGESLLDYDKRMGSQFRAGFAILVQ